MNKTLPAVALAAILAGSLTPALAAEPLPPTTPAMADPIGSGVALTAGALIGTDVTNPAGDTVGEVTDLVIGENNTVSAAIVSVGGFLGVGDRQVAIALTDLVVTPIEDGEYRIQVAATREQLEAMPEVRLN